MDDHLVTHALMCLVKVLLNRMGGSANVTINELISLEAFWVEVTDMPNHGRKFTLKEK